MGGIGGYGAIFQTAARVVEEPVVRALLRSWGEASWTAPDVFEAESARETRRASVGWMLGLPPAATVARSG